MARLGSSVLTGLCVAFVILLSSWSAVLKAATAPSSSRSSSSRSNGRWTASSFARWRVARSLLGSLLQRIFNHRLSKGDIQGAERIKHIKSTLDNGWAFWMNAGTIGWDYLINYSWRNLSPSQVLGILRLVGDLQSAVGELMQLPTDMDRIRWISANYDQLLQIAKSALQKILNLFDQPGAIRNLVLSIQTEVVRGEILRDALQLGAGDLQSLMQVVKDLLWRYYGPSNAGIHSEL